MGYQLHIADRSRIGSVDFDRLRFGEVFSDHMAEQLYADGAWGEGLIKPFGEISLTPAASIFHYGQGIFEGLKAFRYADGRINVFRPDLHYRRFVRSAERMHMPPLAEADWYASIEGVLKQDAAWVPKATYKSYYMRPFMIATEQVLGVRPARRYRYYMMGGPVGDYYSEGVRPVKLTTMPENARSMPGGTGSAKTLANYAIAMMPSQKAMALGYTQVLWLDATERRWVEEVGTSNIFFVIDGLLVTPPLGDTILAGVTRHSTLELARAWDMPVVERPISIDEVLEAGRSGALSEAFATGTAAVVSPIGHIHHAGRTLDLDHDRMGPVAARFHKAITDIHHGLAPDPGGWCHLI